MFGLDREENEQFDIGWTRRKLLPMIKTNNILKHFKLEYVHIYKVDEFPPEIFEALADL